MKKILFFLQGERDFQKTKKNKKMDQFLTLKKANIAPIFNSTIYIYMYICAVKLLAGPSLRVFKVINWAKSKLLTGPRSFSHYKDRGFRRFFAQLSLFVFCAQLSGNFLKIAFFKKRVQKLVFSIFCVLSLNFENYLFFGLLKHYKNRGFGEFLCFLVLKEKKKAKK